MKLKGNVLDIGSGCGVLGILLGTDFDINLTQIEIQEKMAFLTEKNLFINGLKGDVINDSFLNHKFNKKFDFIVSNPPFWDQNVVQTENLAINISRYNNHLPIDDFFKKVSDNLVNRGYFIFCYDSKQLQKILFILNKYNLTVELMRFVYPKIDKESTIVMLKCRKNSKSFVKILNPLIAFDNNNFAIEVQKMYLKARTHTIKCDI
jgi:tRNA1(Val) A37 N6-methylase TrmN6